ncbi:aminotransferase class V-fold PLP-dependent enzyme [Mechercharimyces sp. CAU 1602]|uniref:aminotransferase class V-fold PLP-dependent enzyme n=1 Tax=Mechercharimyces sp. CAU 1602 TaxID=2973933 RepID=UPI0021638035|nr:aminotransferase class V-fold PLP-dependent enzyme [Mechercharimyces sp. CAU 1602]MCS1352685.1 aminotransferase class V-fold PLP-dependent enzyme [Mechercharimyces sp. CAU 1602]
MIYVDNAATSWPKPAAVTEAMKRCLDEYGVNPGRGAYRLAYEATVAVDKARQAVASFFHISDPANLIFCPSATWALNQVVHGLLQRGDHVIATGWEHHAVARPLESLKQSLGIEVTYLVCAEENVLVELQDAIRSETKLVITTHASNVTGTVMPVAQIGELTRKHGIWHAVDAAQTAGHLPIDVEAMGIDLLAFPGHKGLMGPQGIGGLYIHPECPLTPYIQGGTGILSDKMHPPLIRPQAFEGGTLNTPGIAGLYAGIQYIQEQGLETIHQYEMGLLERLAEGLRSLQGIRVYAPSSWQLPVLLLQVEGWDCQEIALILDQQFDIAVRAGLHCAPRAHEQAGTLEDGGAVRISLGAFNQVEEIEKIISALTQIQQVA